MDESSYRGFATMYDALMADAPYDEWAAYIDGVLKERLKANDNPIVLDIACGTGNITLRMADMGYDMIGVDVSTDMLAEARRKADEANHNILFLAQNAVNLDLYGTVDAAISVCDGLNYVLTEEALLTAFKKVKLFLNPQGIFIFDLNTEYKFKVRLGDRRFESFAESGEAYIWENMYHEEKKINEYKMTFFTLTENNEEKNHFEEMHYQKAYPINDVINMLKEAGFSTVSVYDGYSKEPPFEHSTRILFVAEA